MIRPLSDERLTENAKNFEACASSIGSSDMGPRLGGPARFAALRWSFPIVAAAALACAPPFDGVSRAGWMTTALFVGTMLGFALWPLPPSLVALGSLSALAIVGPEGPKRALLGYATPPVWFVFGAMVISRALRDSGLARRIALKLVSMLGATSRGLALALVLGDVALAAVVPSVTARTAGLLLPVGVGLAELHDSRPGSSANRLGRFLVLALYQCSGVACALFLTGQASNALAANLALDTFGVVMSWSNWFAAASVPALVACAGILALVHRLAPPTVVGTPEALVLAKSELAALGPISRHESITFWVAVIGCALFATGAVHRLDLVVIALIAVLVLVGTSVVPWSAVVGDRTLWDTFLWFGGLVSLADALAVSGSPAAVARVVAAAAADLTPLAVFVACTSLAFFSHYLFASITAMVLTLFVPLVLVLTHAGVSPTLACFGIVFAFNLSTGLTHYGSTHGPILFAADYVPIRTWWHTGAIVGALNLGVWLAVGLPWWKVLGLW